MHITNTARLLLLCFPFAILLFSYSSCSPSSEESSIKSFAETTAAAASKKLTSIDSSLIEEANTLYRSKNAETKLDSFTLELKKQFSDGHPVIAHAEYQRGKKEYYKGNYREATRYYKEAIRQYENYGSPADYNTTCKLYRNISICYYYSGNYLDSVYHFAELGWQKMNQYPDALIEDKTRIGLYRWAGIAAGELGDFARAADFLHKGTEICEQGRGDYKICGPIIMNYSLALDDQNLPDSAFYYSKVAESIMLKHASQFTRWDSAHLADIYNNRFEILTAMGDSDAAMEAERNSLAINKIIRPNSPYVAINYNNIGYIYTHQQKLDQARKYLFRSMEINELYQDSFKLAHNYVNLADASKYAGKHKEALYYLNKAFKCYFVDPNALTELTNQYKQKMLLPMSQRARNLYALHQKDPISYALEEVLNAYEQVDSLASALQYSVRSERSKVLVVEKLKPIYEELISICEASYHNNKGAIYLAKAFRYFERSKALVLRERQHRAQYGSLETRVREGALMGDINRLSIRLGRKQLSEIGKSTLLDQLHRTELTLKNFQDSIYYNTAKYESYLSDSTAKFSNEIQQSLTDDQVVIDYFVGDSAIFVSTMTKSKLDIQKLPLSPDVLMEQVDHFRSAINLTAGVSPQERLKKDSTYRASAYWLYQQLIQPLGIPTSTTRLTIIPDGVLAFLPFAALLTEKEAEPEAYATYNYLIKDKIINHQFSLAIWYDNLQQQLISHLLW